MQLKESATRRLNPCPAFSLLEWAQPLKDFFLHFVAVTITQGQVIRQRFKTLFACGMLLFLFCLPLAALHANCRVKYRRCAREHVSMVFNRKGNFLEWLLTR